MAKKITSEAQITRKDRLKKALRENLKRRKTQMRSRKEKQTNAQELSDG